MSSARAGGTAISARRSTRRSDSPDELPGGAVGGEVPSLRVLVQQRFLSDVFQNASDKFPGWKVLVVDEHAMRVVSAAVGMYDIMERKVTLVESLEKKRAPFPDMGVIYLLQPTPRTVSKLLQDFGEKPLYGNGVFLYFLDRLPDDLLNRIKMCKPLVKRVKALVEINLDFLATEDRAFTFDMRDAFSSFYVRKAMTPIEVTIAEKLVTVCATLNEYPHIRYKQSSASCTSLANIFHLKMDEFVAQNPRWWYHGGPSAKNHLANRDRGVLLLLDRADDCLTPLMHDFTYQAMVHDLLSMDGDRITYQSETTNDPTQTEAKDVLLDEKDTLWVELRGKHIAEVIETLSDRIREITSSATGNAFGAKKTGQGNMSLSQMAAALKALPEYREVMSKLSQHMHISHECMDVFKAESLLELSELEQTLATGKDEDGRTPKLADMIDQAERMIMRMKNPKHRLRIILIATISQGGLRQQDRRRLINAAELSRKDMRTLNSLEVLGLSIFSSSDKNKLRAMLTGDRLSSGGASDDEAEYAASRYRPALKRILEELASNELSLEDYPSVLPMPDPAPGQSGSKSSSRGASGVRSARNSRRSGEATSARKSVGVSSRWSKSATSNSRSSNGPRSFSGGRNIVFMLGGLSYPELRVTRDVMDNESREIVIGSTAFVSSSEFMEDLATLGQDDE